MSMSGGEALMRSGIASRFVRCETRRNADGVRDDLRAQVVDHLADADAVPILDETGDLQKGTGTVDVQPTRRYRVVSRIQCCFGSLLRR
jgi:SRSO17 transposase